MVRPRVGVCIGNHFGRPRAGNDIHGRIRDYDFGRIVGCVFGRIMMRTDRGGGIDAVVEGFGALAQLAVCPPQRIDEESEADNHDCGAEYQPAEHLLPVFHHSHLPLHLLVLVVEAYLRKAACDTGVPD